MAKKIKAVIFDFDGTLYDQKGFAFKLIATDLKNAFKAKAERDVRKKIRDTDFGNHEKFLENFTEYSAAKINMDPEKYRDWYINTYMPHFINVLSKWKSRPQVNIVFETLKNNKIKTAIFSDYGFTKERCEALKINLKNVDVIISAEEIGVLKPAKRGFTEVALALKVKPEECIVIGDRIDTDGEGAKRCGMKFIQIATKRTKKILGKKQFLQIQEKDFEYTIQTWENFLERFNIIPLPKAATDS